jgi:hypothetical protein
MFDEEEPQIQRQQRQPTPVKRDYAQQTPVKKDALAELCEAITRKNGR